MFIVALCMVARTWKQSKWLLMDERIKTMWYIYSKEYYSAIRKWELLPFMITWMDLESIMLSEISRK